MYILLYVYVIRAKSTQGLLDRFPLGAQDSGFARPLVPYKCDKQHGCGRGTKRTPALSC